MCTVGHWMILDGASELRGSCPSGRGDRLSARPPGPRNQAADDAIFGSLTKATVSAVSYGQYQFAIKLFDECFYLARQYEKQANCEVHKGAMTFNVAIVYLRANDFSAAMHYLELAQKETRATTGDDDWGIYNFPLFQQNFWRLLDRYEQHHPLSLFADFWSTPFNADDAQKDWERLSRHSKLLYIIINAERISYSRLAPMSNLPISQSFSLMYWNLIADLSRLIETELGARGMAACGLKAKVLQNVDDSLIAGFKARVNHLNTNLSVKNPGDFNAYFLAFRQEIMGPTQPGKRESLLGLIRGGYKESNATPGGYTDDHLH